MLVAPAAAIAPRTLATPLAAGALKADLVAEKAPAKAEPQVNAVGAGVADALRAVGAGYSTYANKNAAVVDQALIHPVETVHAVGTLYKEGTKNIPVVKKTGFVFTALGYLASVQNLIASSLTRAPAETAHDITHAVADSIDGKKSFDQKMGLFVLPDAPAKKAAAPKTTERPASGIQVQ